MKMRSHPYSTVLLVSICLVISAKAADLNPSDADAITSVVEAFHKALIAGEPAKVMALLAPEALITEDGYIQTRSDYQHDHLGEDIAFARAVPVSSRRVALVRQEGKVAWVTATFRVVGEFHKKPVDSSSAETMILTKTSEGWKIETIHWSSHSTPPKEASEHS